MPRWPPSGQHRLDADHPGPQLRLQRHLADDEQAGELRQMAGQECPRLPVGVEQHLRLQRAADELVPPGGLQLLLHRTAHGEEPLEGLHQRRVASSAGLGQTGEEDRGSRARRQGIPTLPRR